MTSEQNVMMLTTFNKPFGPVISRQNAGMITRPTEDLKTEFEGACSAYVHSLQDGLT